MHEHHLGLVGQVCAVTTLGSTTSPCLVAYAHARCRVLAGRGRPRPGHGLAVAWPLLAAVLLPHLDVALLAASGRCHAMLLLLASSPRAHGLAPCCLATSPHLNGAVVAHAALPNCLRTRKFSGCVVS